MWGYDRIQRALRNLGYHIAVSIVANVLKAHRIETASDRKRTQPWSIFLKAHWDSIIATDFTTIEVWTRNGLVAFYVFAVMDLKTQRVHIAEITPSADATWMKQVRRNLTGCEDSFLKDASYLVVDRDTSFINMREFMEHEHQDQGRPRAHGDDWLLLRGQSAINQPEYGRNRRPILPLTPDCQRAFRSVEFFDHTP